MLHPIQYIDSANISNKQILIRVDFNVSLKPDHTIANDTRIRSAIPTLQMLLEKNNKLILTSHLGRPKAHEPEFSLAPVVTRLQELFPQHTVKLIPDFIADNSAAKNQSPNEILVLENIRYYPEEKKGDEVFAKKLSELADVFVNDAFGVSHRADASVVGVTQFLPSYGGLLMKKEVEMILKAIDNPKKPVVAIIGGSKISTKITLLEKLMTLADYLIIGGGLANTFLAAQGNAIGKSICEYESLEAARKLLFQAKKRHTTIVLPTDVVVGSAEDETKEGTVTTINTVPAETQILDIGPESAKACAAVIAQAQTIIWNGPVGYFENSQYRKGTDAIYEAITQNPTAISIVGGGDTLTAIAHLPNREKITHISTGGGAMLELIEKGTLPGIEALHHAPVLNK